MAFWDRLSSQGNVEDRRGTPLAVGAGGLGIVGTLIMLAFTYFSSGGDIGAVLNQLQGSGAAQQSYQSSDFQGADDYERFVSTVLGSNNDVWREVFSRNGRTYAEPKLVLFRDATQSACGLATSQVGPHYCPADRTIYLDETFFDELQSRFKAKGGDVAEAYVIAHEVGHHVQNQLGVTDQFQDAANRGGEEANRLSVKLELQADCFAGVWANSVQTLGVFEEGEVAEAIDAAAAVGDDRIQKTVTGRVDPETWTHGSAAQRVSWFNRGYESGQPNQCDTFSVL